MDAYLLDWANLLLRWAHVITAIAWIGSSFYFVLLDNSLSPPEDADLKAKGIDGELWAVHGGGFYHSNKYMVAPRWRALPDNLHWSYWESYSTWLTGFALFTVLYLFNAGSFLVDKTVYDWSPGTAIAAALGFLAAFWLVYDAICRTLGQRENGDLIVGVLVFVFIVFASWLACKFFAGRAAFLMVGAMIATAMSANVFFWIIPGQRKVVAQLRAGEKPDPIHGQRGKQRSVHNTYFTLPVIVTMLSNHYGWLYQGKNNWIVLVLLMLAGALIRHSFVARHKAHVQHKRVPWEHAIVGTVGAGGHGVLARAAAAIGTGQGRGVEACRIRRGEDAARCEVCDVPQRTGAAEERGAAYARADQATRAGGVPAGVGAQAHADEQRNADHRRRAWADQALVRGRGEGRVIDERATRIELAAAYRLAALNGWDDTVYTHLSATVPGEPGHYLINRFGLLFDEITASSLVKVDAQGRVVDGSSAPVNPSGFAIHGAVHAARPDAACVDPPAHAVGRGAVDAASGAAADVAVGDAAASTARPSPL